MLSLADRITVVRERIAAAARRAGRDPGDVRLVGVTKTHPPDLVRAALNAGLTDFGENRVQEGEAKISALAAERGSMTWHLIGHLQTNKARRAAALFDVIHSVDDLRVAEALSRGRAGSNPGAVRTRIEGRGPDPQDSVAEPLPILLQVNVSGEMTKEGFDLAVWEAQPGRFDGFCSEVERILSLPHLRVCGLMTIAPWGDVPEGARPAFRSTRRLRDQLARRFPGASWHDLSMGMTDDFEVAIEEGATIVRVGRAIFGERH